MVSCEGTLVKWRREEIEFEAEMEQWITNNTQLHSDQAKTNIALEFSAYYIDSKNASLISQRVEFNKKKSLVDDEDD